MTTSKKNTKNATAVPTTKARVAKRSAKTAPLTAEPAPKATGANKPVTAPRGGSKTDKILDLLKRPEGVTLKELAKLWIAERSLPIWAMIVEVPGSCGGFGNANTLFLRFFITTLMPRVRANSNSLRSGLNPASLGAAFASTLTKCTFRTAGSAYATMTRFFVAETQLR